MDYVMIEGGDRVPEKYVCRHCEERRSDAGKLPCMADEQYSFGCYAGMYCPDCWKTSGYRDATDEGAVFDPMDAGESLDED